MVAPDKLRRYLLNLNSPDGAAKAARFLRHNFTADTLGSGLAEHGRNGRLARMDETYPYGMKLEVVEPLPTPLNTYIDVRSVWIVRTSDPSAAHFVTATFED